MILRCINCLEIQQEIDTMVYCINGKCALGFTYITKADIKKYHNFYFPARIYNSSVIGPLKPFYNLTTKENDYRYEHVLLELWGL